MIGRMSEAFMLERIRRLEEQVRLLSQKAGVPFDDGTSGVPDEVVELARTDKRIHAIKRYMEITGADIHTAQRVVGGIV
jgi:hypothetical protein